MAQSGRQTAAPDGEDATRTQRRRSQRQRQMTKGLQAVHILWEIESMLQRYTGKTQSAKDNLATATADFRQGDPAQPVKAAKREPEMGETQHGVQENDDQPEMAAVVVPEQVLMDKREMKDEPRELKVEQHRGAAEEQCTKQAVDAAGSCGAGALSGTADRSAKRREADEYKSRGNELYKNKEFVKALEMYDEAIEREPNELIYYNNKCAVWIEMGEERYDSVLETGRKLVGRRCKINTANPGGASGEKVAKMFCRMASVHERRSEYKEAVEMYLKAQTEDDSRSTKNALREARRAMEELEKERYFDPVKAEEHNVRGNKFGRAGDWAAAKAEYDEGIRRNPGDPMIYANRAAALMRLKAYTEAAKDREECLKLDPSFIETCAKGGTYKCRS